MKIAFVGASGYGNVGDDTYPLVFREHLPDHASAGPGRWASTAFTRSMSRRSSG